MSEFLQQVAVWCAGPSLTVRSIDESAIEVAAASGRATELSHSVGRLWFQQRVDVTPATSDHAAIVACRLANLTRRGILNAHWRVGFVEITGSLRQQDCSSESVLWLFEEAATLEDLVSRQLRPN